MSFTYNSSSDPEYTYLENLLTNCSESMEMYVYVDIDIDYKVWAKSGNTHENREVDIPCPVDPDTAKRILGLLS